MEQLEKQKNDSLSYQDLFEIYQADMCRPPMSTIFFSINVSYYFKNVKELKDPYNGPQNLLHRLNHTLQKSYDVINFKKEHGDYYDSPASRESFKVLLNSIVDEIVNGILKASGIADLLHEVKLGRLEQESYKKDIRNFIFKELINLPESQYKQLCDLIISPSNNGIKNVSDACSFILREFLGDLSQLIEFMDTSLREAATHRSFLNMANDVTLRRLLLRDTPSTSYYDNASELIGYELTDEELLEAFSDQSFTEFIVHNSGNYLKMKGLFELITYHRLMLEILKNKFLKEECNTQQEG